MTDCFFLSSVQNRNVFVDLDLHKQFCVILLRRILKLYVLVFVWRDLLQGRFFCCSGSRLLYKQRAKILRMSWCNLVLVWHWTLFIFCAVFIFSDVVLGKFIMTACRRFFQSNPRDAVISLCTFAATCNLSRQHYAKLHLKQLGDGLVFFPFLIESQRFCWFWFCINSFSVILLHQILKL